MSTKFFLSIPNISRIQYPRYLSVDFPLFLNALAACSAYDLHLPFPITSKLSIYPLLLSFSRTLPLTSVKSHLYPIYPSLSLLGSISIYLSLSIIFYAWRLLQNDTAPFLLHDRVSVHASGAVRFVVPWHAGVVLRWVVLSCLVLGPWSTFVYFGALSPQNLSHLHP